MGKNNAQATAAYKKEMINALEANFGNVTAAAKVVGITPRMHYLWLKSDDEYAYAAESMKDICFRRVKDNLLENALKKIETGDTAVLNKMLGIYFKNIPEEIDRASHLNKVEIITKTNYIRPEEIGEEESDE
jgi:hypothetical protein